MAWRPYKPGDVVRVWVHKPRDMWVLAVVLKIQYGNARVLLVPDQRTITIFAAELNPPYHREGPP